MNQVIKNCGNFSAEILPGMIRYPQETGKGHGKGDANEDMPHGDGYATKEGDIQLGGFIHTRAAQEAARQGERLFTMSLEDKQKIALKVCQDHIAQHGEIGPEYFRRWMRRTRGFAGHHKIQLPPKNDREGDYDYFRRLRRWTMARNESWPELRKAVGTHLVFSPDPKMWEAVRDAGMDERHFLQSILLGTMKDFADWRRKIHGPGHSLGWVGGTHVERDGADRHPHIHVVVLKRDEAGHEVDWSVSALKGRKGRESEPDPLLTVKQLFKKNVEKELGRWFSKEQVAALHNPELKRVTPPFSQAQLNAIRNPSPQLRKFARGVRAVAYAMRSIYGFTATSPQSEFGAMMRIIVAIGRLSQERQQEAYGRIREASRRYRVMAKGVSQENELEPGD